MNILGNHLGHFIEHKRMEEKLANMTVKQRLLLNAIGQGVYGVDTKGKLTFINPAAENMLGWSTDELKGKRIHDIIHHTKSDTVTPLKYYQDGRFPVHHDSLVPVVDITTLQFIYCNISSPILPS